jgi:hypothetical protein
MLLPWTCTARDPFLKPAAATHLVANRIGQYDAVLLTLPGDSWCWSSAEGPQQHRRQQCGQSAGKQCQECQRYTHLVHLRWLTGVLDDAALKLQ